MGHVQRLTAGNDRARAIAGVMALVAGLALFTLARAPQASGQLLTVGIGNSGSGTASTGGNTATGNNSTNDASTSGTSGGLINASVDLGGGASNTSTGTSNVTTGPATAAGNEATTGVNQTTASDGTSSTFTPLFSQPVGQSAGVTNDGSAVASTGGNTATGNNSDNTASLSQTANGLIAANVNLGGATNNSTGTANVTTGPANAAGNVAGNAVNQAHNTGDPSGGFIAGTPFGPGLFPGTVSGFGSSLDPCSGRFFPFSPFVNGNQGQHASVDNVGTAGAGTGNNSAIGNNSTNTATIDQAASGGLIALNLNLGSATNDSTGTATINSGPATASGNQSTTTVNQFCGDPNGGSAIARNPITGAPFAVPVIVTADHRNVVKAQSLARTGIESSLALVAAALVVAGMALLLPARRRLAQAQAGSKVRSSEWDDIVRW